MKAFRTETPKPFEPVTLVLESQQEIDAIFNYLNHFKFLAVNKLPQNTYEALKPFRSHRCDEMWKALDALLK